MIETIKSKAIYEESVALELDGGSANTWLDPRKLDISKNIGTTLSSTPTLIAEFVPIVGGSAFIASNVSESSIYNTPRQYYIYEDGALIESGEITGNYAYWFETTLSIKPLKKYTITAVDTTADPIESAGVALFATIENKTSKYFIRG